MDVRHVGVRSERLEGAVLTMPRQHEPGRRADAVEGFPESHVRQVEAVNGLRPAIALIDEVDFVSRLPGHLGEYFLQRFVRDSQGDALRRQQRQPLRRLRQLGDAAANL